MLLSSRLDRRFSGASFFFVLRANAAQGPDAFASYYAGWTVAGIVAAAAVQATGCWAFSFPLAAAAFREFALEAAFSALSFDVEAAAFPALSFALVALSNIFPLHCPFQGHSRA